MKHNAVVLVLKTSINVYKEILSLMLWVIVMFIGRIPFTVYQSNIRSWVW